jgi:putative FmdB family regulatory protein
MPVYEYYCDNCKKVFDALGSITASDRPAKCPKCGRPADRIMPTAVATMSRRQGLRERVPFHHHDIRTEAAKKPIARVKPKAAAPRSTKKKATK